MARVRTTHIERYLQYAIVALLVGAAGFITYQRFSHQEPEPLPKVSVRPIDATDHILGSLRAPVHIIVYADLECSFCKRFHFEALPQITEKYGKDVVVAYRHSPMPSRSKALPEALAAECAAIVSGEDAFWRFVDVVYRNTPSDNGLELSRLPTLAKAAGVNVSAFEECRENKSSETAVFEDMRDASRAEVRIVPTFVLIRGAESVTLSGYYRNSLFAAIDAFVAGGRPPVPENF